MEGTQEHKAFLRPSLNIIIIIGVWVTPRVIVTAASQRQEMTPMWFSARGTENFEDVPLQVEASVVASLS